jgi:hypothetical protein
MHCNPHVGERIGCGTVSRAHAASDGGWKAGQDVCGGVVGVCSLWRWVMARRSRGCPFRGYLCACAVWR